MLVWGLPVIVADLFVRRGWSKRSLAPAISTARMRYSGSDIYRKICIYGSLFHLSIVPICLTLGFIWRYGDLNTLCHSCGVAFQQRVVKIFPGPGFFPSKDGVVWLCHLLVNLYVLLPASPCYDSIPLTLELIRREGGLSILCHSFRFPC